MKRRKSNTTLRAKLIDKKVQHKNNTITNQKRMIEQPQQFNFVKTGTQRSTSWVYFFAIKFLTNVQICSKNFGHLKFFSAKFMNERFYKLTKSKVNYYCKRFSWEFVSNFVINNAIKIQLKILRLTPGSIVNAKSLRYAGS